MNRRTLFFSFLVVLSMAHATSQVFAAVPTRSLGFQGQLFDGSTPLTSSVNATFTFYDALSGGNVTGSPISKTVTVSNGYFGTQFSEVDLAGVDFNQALYVQVNINGTNLSPRSALNSAPSSLKSFGAFSYSSAPTVGTSGSMYFNTTDGKLYVSNGTAWVASTVWTVNGADISFLGGNVGIGTTTPVSPIHIYGNGSSARMTFESNMSGTTASADIRFRSLDGEFGGIGDASSGRSHMSIWASGSSTVDFFVAGQNKSTAVPKLRVDYTGNIGISSSTPAAALSVQGIGGATSDLFAIASSTGAPFLHVASAGNVGIGTSAPGSQLHVNGSATSLIRISSSVSPEADMSLGATGDTTFASLRLQPSTGNKQAALALVPSGTGTSSVVQLSNGGSSWYLRSVSGSGFGIGGTTLAASPFFIANSTNVGIGTTTPTASFHASGTIRFSSLGAGTLSTDALGNVTVSSDERLKDIQGAFATGLDKVLSLTPITYKWKTETGFDTEHSYAGFSAQNVKEAIPEAVSTDPRGFLSLSDRPILAALVNAVKEIGQWFSEKNTFTVKENATLRMQGQVCVDELCVSKEQFKNMLRQSIQGGGNGSGITYSSTPIPPSPTPEVVSEPTEVSTTTSTSTLPVEESSAPEPEQTASTTAQ